jgi:hypothetical protein
MAKNLQLQQREKATAVTSSRVLQLNGSIDFINFEGMVLCVDFYIHNKHVKRIPNDGAIFSATSSSCFHQIFRQPDDQIQLIIK